MRFIMYTKELWDSPAYQRLTIPARNLLHFLFNERRWKGKGKNRVCTNNKEIKLNRKQFINQYGYTIETVKRSKNLLITVGFIRLQKQGGNCRGDMNEYSLEIDLFNPRWKRYPDENWEHEIPQSKSNLGKRWVKGESGNPKYKNNYSLSDVPLNHQLPSIAVSPKVQVSVYDNRQLIDTETMVSE